MFNAQGWSRQLKLFPFDGEPPRDDPAVVRGYATTDAATLLMAWPSAGLQAGGHGPDRRLGKFPAALRESHGCDARQGDGEIGGHDDPPTVQTETKLGVLRVPRRTIIIYTRPESE